MSSDQTNRECLSRRKMIQTVACGLAASMGVAKGATKGPGKVDTHLHCFAGRNNANFPYHKNAPYRPAEEASPQHLLNCMEGAGVSAAIVVHPEPYQDDHRYLRHCLEVGKGKLKGTCLFFSENPEAPRQLRELATGTDLVAARIHAYAPDRLPPFEGPELRRLWSEIADLGLAVQLHFEPRYAPRFEPLIKEFKATPVIIDHMGRPFQGTPEEHEKVIRWGQLPNTIMKFSSIPDQRQYPHRNIRPVIRRLVSEFGVEKMIYGGGFNSNATPESYRAAFERARGYLDFLAANDQERIFGGNAKKLFGW